MDWVAGQYAIYGLDDVILNTEGRMQMRYNIKKYINFTVKGLFLAKFILIECQKTPKYF